MMDKHLRVLNVEDSERDCALLKRHVKAAGYDLLCERVETAAEMKAALAGDEWDIILCDYSMPQFSALAALGVLRASNIDLPFIIISGTVGEEIAVNALLTGANDYIPKGNLTRLVPAIERELQQADSRRAKRKAEASLKASEGELRALFAAMSDTIMVFDYEGRHIKVAPTKPGHVYGRGIYRIGKSVHEIFKPDVADVFLDNIRRSLDEARTLQVEYSLMIGRQKVWFDATVTPMTDDSVMWVARDVTERKRAEDDIQRRQTELRVLFDVMPAMIWFKDTENNILHVNKRVADAAELTVEEIEGKSSLEIYPNEAAKFYADDLEVIRSGKPKLAYVEMLSGTDGKKLWVQTDKVPYFDEAGKPMGIVVMAQDVTERKKTEAALEESEFRFRSLFENMLEGYAYCETIFKKDKLQDFIYTEVNGAFGTLTGLKDVVGKKVTEVVPGIATTNPKLFEIYGRVALTGDSEKFETYVERLEIWLSISVYSSGRENFVVVFDNITERKRSEERVRKSEANLARSQQIAHLGSWEMDVVQNGTLLGGNLRWSDEVFRILGYQPGEIEVSPERFFARVHPDDRASVADAVAQALRLGTEYRLDHRVVKPDGTERTVHGHGEIISDAVTGKPVMIMGTIQDITEQRQIEAQLRQSQKMEAVGVLSGGIAHDFNNLLTAINGYSDLTLRKMSADDPLRNNIKEIKNAGDRAADLTGNLLTFSRKQVLKPRVYNLNAAITEIDKMLRRIMRENIELRTVLAPDLGNIKADPGQIEQVIMNLGVNAREAMPNGGTLTIETKNVSLDEGYVSQHIAISPGAFVKLTVTDTGEGMDAETQRHIFEPFFTTKDVGKGTGLGLSTVYGIVKQSGGDITVRSEVGKGTAFTIYFPCVAGAVETVKWAGDPGEKYSGTETILLVEDEDIVRKLICEVLTDNGYKVLEAASGKEALTVCETISGPIHMLLTDVIMPKMSGNKLRDIIVKSYPDIKILFMSGYTGDAIAHRGIFDLGSEFIEKPFTPDGLARKVREVLEYKQFQSRKHGG